jgi:hypothetical protein
MLSPNYIQELFIYSLLSARKGFKEEQDSIKNWFWQTIVYFCDKHADSDNEMDK